MLVIFYVVKSIFSAIECSFSFLLNFFFLFKPSYKACVSSHPCYPRTCLLQLNSPVVMLLCRGVWKGEEEFLLFSPIADKGSKCFSLLKVRLWDGDIFSEFTVWFIVQGAGHTPGLGSQPFCMALVNPRLQSNYHCLALKHCLHFQNCSKHALRGQSDFSRQGINGDYFSGQEI